MAQGAKRLSCWEQFAMTSPASCLLPLTPPFEQQWAKDNNGDKLTIKQSHAGSSKTGAGDPRAGKRMW